MTPMFQPRDPDYEARVRASFARQSAMVTMGARLTAVAPGAVTVELIRSDAVLQQHGFVHGGVVASIADSAAGYAALSLMGAAQGVLTVEFKINFLAPAAQPALVARGRVIRPGRSMSVVQADVFGLEDGGEVAVAILTGTMAVVERRPGIVD